MDLSNRKKIAIGGALLTLALLIVVTTVVMTPNDSKYVIVDQDDSETYNTISEAVRNTEPINGKYYIDLQNSPQKYYSSYLADRGRTTPLVIKSTPENKPTIATTDSPLYVINGDSFTNVELNSQVEFRDEVDPTTKLTIKNATLQDFRAAGEDQSRYNGFTFTDSTFDNIFIKGNDVDIEGVNAADITIEGSDVKVSNTDINGGDLLVNNPSGVNQWGVDITKESTYIPRQQIEEEFRQSQRYPNLEENPEKQEELCGNLLSESALSCLSESESQEWIDERSGTFYYYNYALDYVDIPNESTAMISDVTITQDEDRSSFGFYLSLDEESTVENLRVVPKDLSGEDPLSMRLGGGGYTVDNFVVEQTDQRVKTEKYSIDVEFFGLDKDKISFTNSDFVYGIDEYTELTLVDPKDEPKFENFEDFKKVVEENNNELEDLKTRNDDYPQTSELRDRLQESVNREIAADDLENQIYDPVKVSVDQLLNENPEPE